MTHSLTQNSRFLGPSIVSSLVARARSYSLANKRGGVVRSLNDNQVPGLWILTQSGEARRAGMMGDSGRGGATGVRKRMAMVRLVRSARVIQSAARAASAAGALPSAGAAASAQAAAGLEAAAVAAKDVSILAPSWRLLPFRGFSASAADPPAGDDEAKEGEGAGQGGAEADNEAGSEQSQASHWAAEDGIATEDVEAYKEKAQWSG